MSNCFFFTFICYAFNLREISFDMIQNYIYFLPQVTYSNISKKEKIYKEKKIAEVAENESSPYISSIFEWCCLFQLLQDSNWSKSLWTTVRDTSRRLAASGSVKFISIYPIARHLNKSCKRQLLDMANNILVPIIEDQQQT